MIRSTTVCALALAAATLLIPASARAADTILHNFTASGSDGNLPPGSLTLSGSNLYGMTNSGGSGSEGTIFSLNTDGSGFGVLHTFVFSASDGRNPEGSLTLSGSNLYGMTYAGGSADAGTIFSLNTNGTGFTLLHSFSGLASDGQLPNGSLTLSGSTLYGMTTSGGTSNLGTIFSLNTNGTGYGLLHTFTSATTDGKSPFGSLTLSGSTLYGMTRDGGGSNGGTLFSMNVDGTGFTLLHSFAGGASDGSAPYGSLTLSGTKLFGLTNTGGSNGAGTLFSMNVNGTGFTLLHSFVNALNDGQDPFGSLTLLGSKLYGMTYAAGGNSLGTVFSINTDGSSFALLQSFAGGTGDGSRPRDSLTLSGDASTLYGMTESGGTANVGVVFSVPAPTPTPSPTPTPTPPAQSLNVSTRLEVGTGDKVSIGGIIITPGEAKRVLLRAIGPSLANFGIADPLADPVLELHASDGTLITSNDNWNTPPAPDIEATGLAPTNPLESAILVTLDPGLYTAVVTGKAGGTGVGLVEAYDLDQSATSQLGNLSTRGFVDTGNNVMIGGFILGPDGAPDASVLVRAIGPSLIPFGVTDALADPVLELHDANGTLIKSNDNWNTPPAPDIEATGLAPTNPLESAILTSLPPGGYTAIVAGKGGLTGVALVEVYRLP